ncbi:MAG: tetratricopeptide repeat protein [Phycisphaerae bacterium]|nr:tetratricopeptide repeat protein [Phycisphaerae bacterium]
MTTRKETRHPAHRPTDRRLLAALIVTLGAAAPFLACRSGDDRAEPIQARIAACAGKFADFNVLLVSIDTLRADRVGCYGCPVAETPTIDGLARRGLRCDSVVTPVPLTLPGHASLLTGLMPPHHGARVNVIYTVPAKVRTLAEILHDRGYATGAAISAFVLDRRFGLDQGFDAYLDDLSADGQAQAFGYQERIAEDTNRHALAWLERHGRERFFLWAHYFDPHFPYKPPAPFSERFKDRPYDGEIAYADAQLGRLVGALDDLGVRDRTLIVVTSDHGESLGEHGESTHGLLLYDATLLVPLVFSGPPPLPQGVTLSREAGLIDVVPTLLDLLGVTIPSDLDGISLLCPAPAAPRNLYIETLWPKLMHNWAPLAGVRRRGWKYILAPRPELYDLTSDPNELSNLYEQKKTVAEDMHRRLRELAGLDPGLLADVSGNLAITDEARQKLAGLGYVVTSSAPTTTSALPDPKDMIRTSAETDRAMELAHAGRFEEAVAILEPFVYLHPKDAVNVGVLAECYLSLGRARDAAEMFRKQADLSQRKTEPLIGLGLAHVQMGRLDEAEGYLRAALAESPEHQSALFGLGVIAAQRGRREEAMTLLRRSVETGRGSQTAVAHYNIGVLHEKAGQIDEAREAYRRALSLDRHQMDAARAEAMHLEKAGRAEEAIQLLAQAIGNRPAPGARMQLGKLLLGRDRLSAAAGQFRLVAQARPNDAVARYELGIVLNRLGETGEAIGHLKRCVALQPDNLTARLHLGVALGQKGDLDGARKELEAVVAKAPTSAVAHYNLGAVLAKQRRLDEARNAFAESVRLDAKNASARIALGQVLLELGHPEAAAVQYREALKIAPAMESARAGLKRIETQPARQ